LSFSPVLLPVHVVPVDTFPVEISDLVPERILLALLSAGFLFPLTALLAPVPDEASVVTTIVVALLLPAVIVAQVLISSELMLFTVYPIALQLGLTVFEQVLVFHFMLHLVLLFVIEESGVVHPGLLAAVH